MGYKFKLNENADIDRKSINGTDLSREWSRTYSNKPEGLLSSIRTRVNLDGIVDCRYESDTDPSKIYFDSERDCVSKIVLYHKNEFSSMPRMEQMRIAEMYNIKYVQFMDDVRLQKELNDAQYQFELKLLEEKQDIKQYFSEMRNYMNSKQE